jgi:hypothetical protein
MIPKRGYWRYRTAAVECRDAGAQFVNKPISLTARSDQANGFTETGPDKPYGKANDTESPGVVDGQINPKSDPCNVDHERCQGARHAQPTRAGLLELVETRPGQLGLISRECGDQPFDIGAHREPASCQDAMLLRKVTPLPAAAQF